MRRTTDKTMHTEADPDPWALDGPGDCYRRAVQLGERLAAEAPAGLTVEVVHGLVTGTGGDAEGLRYGHAWIEIGRSLCADDSLGGEPMVVPAPVYYEAGAVDPEETHRYSLKEAHRAMVEHRHYGPWHRDLAPKDQPIAEMEEA